VKTFFSRLAWTGELPASVNRYRRTALIYVLIVAVAYPLSTLPFYMHTAFLGPGMGEPVDLQPLWDLLAWAEQSGKAPLLYAIIALVVFNLAFRARIILSAYFGFKDDDGKPYPVMNLLVFGLVNMVGAGAVLAFGVFIGLALLALGGDFQTGLGAIKHMSLWAHVQVMTHVPTIVELPPFVALFVMWMAAGFVHYWLHRFGHTFRAGWLLFHRPHHMPNLLSPQATLPVFFSIPLILLVAVPYNFMFAGITKLVSVEPLYMESILLSLFLYIPADYGHSTALYQEGRRNPIIRWMGWFFWNGPYHYLHHSAEPADAGKAGAVNMVNIGGGLFGFWDWVFGTYRPLRDDRPPVGLTGCPELVMNPVRLAFSGTMQILYELWMNRSWKDRFWILFGSSAWNPPITRDFAIHNPMDGNAEHAATSP